MKRSLIALAVVGTLLSVSATVSAAPKQPAPKLNGTYVYTWIEQCRQPGVNGAFAGVGQTTGLMSFDAAAGTVSFTGYAPMDGNPLLEPVSGTGTFSNAATTVTLSGEDGPEDFQAFYGDVQKD